MLELSLYSKLANDIRRHRRRQETTRRWHFWFYNFKNCIKLFFRPPGILRVCPGAFFLNDYLQLKINIRSIAFHTIWYEGKQKQNINSIIESLNNNPLRGLYYLSKDFHSDTEYLASTDDDAKELSEIRNCLEHRYVKITQYKNVENIYPYDNFAYQITIDEFERKIEKILHYVREAIIYLSLAVHTNEEQNYPKDKIIGPIIMGEI